MIITRVIDGDTVCADIDCGFRHWIHGERLRLAGIDTPELNGPNSAKARAALARLTALVGGNRDVTILTDKPDKYGRWLATIFVGGENVNQILLNEGLAVALG